MCWPHFARCYFCLGGFYVARGLRAGLVWCSSEATVVALSGRIAPRGGVMVGELVASSAALRFAGGWSFGVLLKQLAFLSLAALQARRVMVGKCVTVTPRLTYRRSGLRCIV